MATELVESSAVVYFLFKPATTTNILYYVPYGTRSENTKNA